jgi:hypothetical protein
MDDISKPPTPAENTAEKQRGRPFEPGQSGNPLGRPKGARNKTTLAAENLLEGEAEAIVRKLVEKAKSGDPTALRLCVERFMPARRDRTVAFDFPQITRAEEAVNASSAVIAACAEGTLSPDEATKFMSLISVHVQTLQFSDVDARLRTREQNFKDPSQ